MFDLETFAVHLNFQKFRITSTRINIFALPHMVNVVSNYVFQVDTIWSQNPLVQKVVSFQ